MEKVFGLLLPTSRRQFESLKGFAIVAQVA
jgi:hypothetical protein